MTEISPVFIGWALVGIIAVYIVVRVLNGRMLIWSKADDNEDARVFRSAIFAYKPIWAGVLVWAACAITTFVLIYEYNMQFLLPVTITIALQLWKMCYPRDYRGAMGKVLCGTLPFTIAFFCVTMPKQFILSFIVLLAWIIVSMLMQVLVLKAISNWDFKVEMQKAAFFDKQNIFGEAGKGLLTSGFDKSKIERGVIGEKKTADVLNYLARENSELFVFHSVRWLNNGEYDIDHILYYKDNAIFLDSKFWGAGTHEIDNDGRVYKDGKVRDLELHLDAALEQYANYFYDKGHPLNKTDVWIVIQGNDNTKSVIGQYDSNDAMMLVSGSELKEQVENWMNLVDTKGWAGYRDPRVLSLFLERVK